MPHPARTPLLRRSSRSLGALAVTLALGGLTACSGGSDSPSAGSAASSATGAQTLPTQTSDAAPSENPGAQSSPVALTATETDFAIELSQKELAAGSYAIEVANDGDAVHDLIVEDADGKKVAGTPTISPGQSGTLEVTLEPGEYVFYCSVGNHRGMGMELPVTVT